LTTFLGHARRTTKTSVSKYNETNSRKDHNYGKRQVQHCQFEHSFITEELVEEDLRPSQPHLALFNGLLGRSP
jgi:hypothetical protein